MRRALLVVVLLLAVPAIASARPLPGHPKPAAPPAAPAPPSPSVGVPGAPDITGSLGMNDVTCSHLAGASAAVVRNCASDQKAGSPYPPSNWSTDTNIDTGLTDPGNDVASILQNVFSWMFGVFVTIIAGTLALLGDAFRFDLFALGQRQIGRGLGNAESGFVWPMMALALGVLGFVLLKHLATQNMGKVLSHTVAAFGLIAVGIVILEGPVQSLGWADNLGNGLAQGAVGIFTGSPGNGSASFANSEPGIWRVAIEQPWCAAEFGSIDWCMAPIDPTMAAARASVLQNLDDAAGNQASVQVARQQEPLERMRLADARTNGELFAAFPVNWNARNGKDSWTLYAALLKEHPELAAIRGSGGVAAHIVALLLGGIAGAFFLLLLGYICIQILTASFVFVVCLLFAPLLVLLPVVESGQRAFMKWLGFLVLALFRKTIYALALGVILLCSQVLFSVTHQLGWFLSWIILAAFWGICLHHRHMPMRLVGHEDHVPHPVRTASGPARTAAEMGVAVGAATAGRAVAAAARAKSKPKATMEPSSNGHAPIDEDVIARVGGP